MKKKVCLILVLCTIAAVLCGCSSSYEEPDTKPNNSFSKGYFTTIKKWDGGVNFPLERIVYANDTGVMYYVFIEGYTGGITPLYNTDGTLQIYKGE